MADGRCRVRMDRPRCMCSGDEDGVLLEFRVIRTQATGASQRIIAFCPLCREGKMITARHIRAIHEVEYEE